MNNKCKFYEVDEVAKKECEKEMADYRKLIGEEAFIEEQKHVEAMTASLGEECDKLAQCKEFCKYLAGGKGYPGEWVCYCKCPGHEHVIDVDFHESEVI